MRAFAKKPLATQQTTPANATIPCRPHLTRIGTAFPHLGLHFSRIPVNSPTARAIQAKLAINTPGDEAEQEADRVAEQVINRPAPGRSMSIAAHATPLAAQPIESEHETAQAKGMISSAHSGYIQCLQGRGGPLPQPTRAFFESRFGYDFSQVRIHTDTQAAQAAQGINARALTSGQDIVFGHGQFQPQTARGQYLLAHELTHVVQQSRTSTYASALPMLQRDLDDNEPGQGFRCGLLEMSLDDFDESKSCCDENTLNQLNRMREQASEALRIAIQRISSGAAIDGLLRLHFGASGPSQRSIILSNIRQTLAAAESFRNNHTFLCRPLSDRFGCTGWELARAGPNTDITACMETGSPRFDWETILHEFFHVSGVAVLPTLGENATPAQEARGEFETYYDPQGESENPKFQRYPSAEPLRNADSYAQLVAALNASDWSEEGTATRFIPSVGLGAGIAFGGDGVEPVVAARFAFTPLGPGVHFITPGIVGLWMPRLGTVDADDPNTAQPRGYVGGELGLRAITGASSVAGVFDLGAGVGSVFRRDEAVDVGALVRASAGIRFGAPDLGVSVNTDLMRIFDFALEEQRTDGWIVGLSVQGHWGGHSGAPR
jgi:hypothetical protein